MWTPVTGESLICAREEDNAHDRYAVAVLQHDTIVGHLPRSVSTVCSLFIRRSGSIRCVITDRRRYSRDLPQGGMEVPCKLHFLGNESELKKIKSYFAKVKAFTVETTTQSDQSTRPEKSIVKINDPACAVVKAELTFLKAHPCSYHDILPIPAEQGDNLPSCSTSYITLPDDGSCPVNELQDVWVTHDDHSLSLPDRVVIEQGEHLTDKHMQMAQYLAKKQFPLAGGLRSTLLQQKGVKGQCTTNTVQIVHCEKDDTGWWLQQYFPRKVVSISIIHCLLG